MADLRQGTITVDGVGIAGLAGSDVCTEINVVPQEPFFMPGTVRFNLDPQDGGPMRPPRQRSVGLGSGGWIQRDPGGLGAESVALEWWQG
jgi:hypothetical protein